jgi:acyl carrier protein
MTRDRSDVLATLTEMIQNVMGEDDLEVSPAMSFRNDLDVNSIEFVSFAGMIQEEFEGIDFATWISGKPQEAFYELTVGDVADFIVSQAA